jgi:NadR type nicotinamide-nucleotide adenylyltransferase
MIVRILIKYAHFRQMDTENGKKVIRIAIVGPECTGKTDLSRFLAHHYQTRLVPEYAREYIDQLNRPYEKSDLLAIAKTQLLVEDKLAQEANKILICDTNLLIIKIWSEFKYGDCAAEIVENMVYRKYDLHLLMYIDIPWVDDLQREHPDKRALLYELYRNELIRNKINFIEVKGSQELRREAAVNAIEKIMDKSHAQHL